MTAQTQRNARAIARLRSGCVLHIAKPELSITIERSGDWFGLTKRYESGDFIQIKELSGAALLDELDRMNISIGE